MLTIVWQLLTLVGVLVALIAVLTAAVDKLLTKKERVRIRQRATTASVALEKAEPFAVVKGPLRLFSTTLDVVYTSKILSWRGFLRASAINTILCVAALLIVGVVTGKPLGVETAPWTVFDQTLQAIEQTQAVYQNAYPEQVAELNRWFATALSFKTPAYKSAYIFGFIAFIIVLSWALEFVCLAVARALVREMIEVRTPLALTALHTFNFLFVAVAACVALCIAVVAGAPIIWPVVSILYKLSIVSIGVAVALWIIAIFCLVVFSPVWIRVVVAVAALPSVVLLISTLIALLLVPFRRRIHLGVSWLLERIRSNEKAVIASGLTIFFVCLVGIAAFLTYLPSALKPMLSNPLSGVSMPPPSPSATPIPTASPSPSPTPTPFKQQ